MLRPKGDIKEGGGQTKTEKETKSKAKSLVPTGDGSNRTSKKNEKKKSHSSKSTKKSWTSKTGEPSTSGTEQQEQAQAAAEKAENTNNPCQDPYNPVVIPNNVITPPPAQIKPTGSPAESGGGASANPAPLPQPQQQQNNNTSLTLPNLFQPPPPPVKRPGEPLNNHRQPPQTERQIFPRFTFQQDSPPAPTGVANMGYGPQFYKCPKCFHENYTHTEVDPCCGLFKIRRFSVVRHYCAQCGSFVGKYNP